MAAIDNFPTKKELGGLNSPYEHAFAISPHDTNELSNVTRAIWVGGLGNVKLQTAGGELVTFTAVAAGTLIPIRANLVHTDTTATLLIGLY